MSLEVQEIPSDCVVVASVVCDGQVDSRAFAELDQAIAAIREHIDLGDATYVAIEAHVRGSAPSDFYKSRIQKNTVDLFQPYARFTTEFWDQALTNPTLCPLLADFLAKVEEMSRYATRDDGGIWYLCEDDLVLFCQPIFGYLAMRSLEFVPHYTRMLSCWRTEEAADWCGDDVLWIVRQHGRCVETDLLVRAYFANGGYYLDQEDFPHLVDH